MDTDIQKQPENVKRPRGRPKGTFTKLPKPPKTKPPKPIKGQRGRPKGTTLESAVKSIPDVKYTYKLLPTQMEFFNSTYKETLYSGGAGSGKSLALCLKLAQQASIPGNTCILCRKTLTSLKASTIRMLLEPEGDRSPILPFTGYEHNKVERRITINGGGTILYTGLEDSESIRSLNAGDVFIDEASQLTEQDYLELLLRLRVNTGGLRIYSATNPSYKHHWLYKRFILDTNPNRKAIFASSLDNIYLPKSTIDSFNDLKGDTRDKFVLGLWTDREKAIYKDFDPQVNVRNCDIEIVKHIISLDYGYTNPTAIIHAGLDKDNRLWVLDEWEESKKLNRDILKKLEEYRDLQPVVLIDPSAANFIAETTSNGWNAIKANNVVEMGIDRVKSRFIDRSIFLSQSCEKLIDEVANYTYDESFKPVKINDHLCDALRYIVNYTADLQATVYEDNANKSNFYIF